MGKQVIEDALQGYSEEVKIIKAGMAIDRFEIVIDEHGFNSRSMQTTSSPST